MCGVGSGVLGLARRASGGRGVECAGCRRVRFVPWGPVVAPCAKLGAQLRYDIEWARAAPDDEDGEDARYESLL